MLPVTRRHASNSSSTAIAFTEWTIRSFDTKAQISIAAFVLSINPLWSMLTSAFLCVSSPLTISLL